MEIKYYRKNVSGLQHWYAADPTIEKAIRLINNEKTLDESTVQGLKILGFKFTEVLPPKEI